MHGYDIFFFLILASFHIQKKLLKVSDQSVEEIQHESTTLNRYESVLSAKMTKSLGKSVINLYSNAACSVLGVGNQQELSTDLESDPFLNTALQKFRCDLYYRFGAMLVPVSVGIISRQAK